MRVRTPGKILEGLWLLGREESNVYLLQGESGSLLIGGGGCHILPELLGQFREFGIDESGIGNLLVLHSHYDHVGIVPFLKRRNPGMRILASARSLEIFRKPKAIQGINASNRYVLETLPGMPSCSEYDWEWRDDVSGEPVKEGDRIDLGGVEVQILETPGHSPCMVSAYVPKMKVLFPSEAAGVPLGKMILTYGTSDYTKYEENLRKLKELDVEIVCADHSGYVVGEEGSRFVEASIEAARQRRELMLDTFRQQGSVEAASKVLADRLRDENVGDMISFETFTQAFRQMVGHVVRAEELRIT
jgi:glyoxylase-like metal-dependent hydrolase (beta-lactamase superfamily II)